MKRKIFLPFIFLAFAAAIIIIFISNLKTPLKNNVNQTEIMRQFDSMQVITDSLHTVFESITTAVKGQRIGNKGFIVNHEILKNKDELQFLISQYYTAMQGAKEWNDKKKILSLFSEKDMMLIQQKDMTKIKSLENYTDYNYNAESQNITAEKIDFDLSKLNKCDFGTMYLFDLFGDSCSHGDKVFDVVKQILHIYKLDSVIQNIVLRPVNYFSNIEQSDTLYYDYYKKYIDIDYSGRKEDLVIDSKNPNIDSDETPTNYLEAIYTMAIDAKPDIISSSYKGTCGMSYIEKSMTTENTYTNYLTAALNDPPYDVDNLKLRERVIGSTYSIIEPLASYVSDLNDKGSLIIGNQIDSNKYIGMYSGSGSNVTALGAGVHWGDSQCTKCINPIADVGTSFATPDVATKLLIAKAWWRKQNFDCDALEARKRLILATNLNENFVGKFASGGSISLNKLLQTNQGYLVTNDNTVIPLDTIYNAIIMNEQTFTKIKSGNKYNEISGIYSIKGKVAVLKNETSPKWEFIGTPSDINIVAKRKSDQSFIILSKDSFISTYKQLVILK